MTDTVLPSILDGLRPLLPTAVAIGLLVLLLTSPLPGRGLQPFQRRDPWRTVVSNGQALCRGHNRRKSNARPPWWYVLALERRRAGYCPPNVDVRVHARMSADERAARASWKERRRR